MRIYPLRIIIIWIFESLSLLLLDELSSDISINDAVESFFFVVIIGLINALLWPMILRLLSSLHVILFFIGTILLNGLMVVFASDFLDGIIIAGIDEGLLVTFWLTALNFILSGLLSLNDTQTYNSLVVKRLVQSVTTPIKTDKAGIIFLEIDGLSKPILDYALEHDYLPTLAEWLKSGSHQVVEWECDWSSQTSASQAGILHGSNDNMPAFRWYERASEKVMVSNHPNNTATMEKRQSNGEGLLANEGVSISNMFSGDATARIMTVSQLTNPTHIKSQHFKYFFSSIFNLGRVVLLTIWDIIIELWSAWRQRRRDERPRVHRSGIYPILRAFTTVILTELNTYNILAGMFAGVPSIYATFVGYDEVAHHSGIKRPDALAILRKTDHYFARLVQAVELAPRPYHFVILSDHGQSQGATFKQRYGRTLEDTVDGLLSDHLTTTSFADTDEGWGHLNTMLTTAIQSETNLASRALMRVMRAHIMDDGTVVYGPEYDEHTDDEEESHTFGDVIVLASGNLGLIYFKGWKDRLTLEEINQMYPELVNGLATHEGIGFVLVRSEQHGAIAIGANGRHYLDEDRIEGDDPLLPFGKNAKQHLLRTDGFPHVADIMVNSLYDSEANEVAAFEELVGSHGGLGGGQTRPFLMYPTELPMNDGEIIGAEAVYAILRQWTAQTT